MSDVEKTLREANYIVWNESYLSLSAPVESLSGSAIARALAHCRERGATKIHFATHSMGGILVRHYLQEHHIPELGRILMLSPPNQGSEVSDQLRDSWYYRAFLGPAAQQLGTDGITRSFKPIEGTIGIITGAKGSHSWFLPDIPGPDDGKVSVTSAKLAEMSDFLIVPFGHTFIMNEPSVLAQALYFMRHGRFDCMTRSCTRKVE